MSRQRIDLGLPEQLVLLALNDARGTVSSGATWYLYGLAGAVLSELLLTGAVTLASEGKKQWVDVVRHRPLEDEVLDEALSMIQDSKRRLVGDWVNRLASKRDPRHRVAQSLCRRGVLDDCTDKVLLLFTRRTYPTLNPEPEARLIADLEQAMASDHEISDPRTKALLSMAHSADILKVCFQPSQLKSRKTRLDRLTAEDPVAMAVKELISTIQIATMVVVS